MKAHKNARTTLHSRQILVERIGQGLPAWQVAQDVGVSRQTSARQRVAFILSEYDDTRPRVDVAEQTPCGSGGKWA
jgi:hypothetical protein